MSIVFDRETGTLTLSTLHTTYQMQIGRAGHLCHLYYGRRTPGDRLDYQFMPPDAGFSPNPYEARATRDLSPDLHPQEYCAGNAGDYRVTSLVSEADGVYGADLRYAGHRIEAGKFSIPGMPASFAREDEAATLTVSLSDEATGLRVELLYGVFERDDVIARAARIVNGGKAPLRLHKAASALLDIPFGEWDMIHFHGRHLMERLPQRAPVIDGIQTVSSRRGASSHQQNPFVILCDRHADEDGGDCYGAMLVYSGNHRTDVERDQIGSVRLVSGIHDEQFLWTLQPGEAFDTPEALLAFTHRGLTALSHLYHRFIRGHIMASAWAGRRRPVLLNNWEATYFDFDAGKIAAIAERASALGVELFVLDDGWFGRRNDDNSSLGDWAVNEGKLPGGLDPLIERINALGMRFGLWIEPEMVSEDSDLYRAHPDWALTVPGRRPHASRNQLVLDLARPEVVEHLYGVLSGLLRAHRIGYVKWDMNRHLTDVYSRALPPERQGEAYHRYMLGLYGLLERLTAEFRDVLFEGCSGGGGRFDAAMLRYFPQIWCSDNTDAVDRLSIQHGTSFGYPVSAVGAHVSVSPNHQTGRVAPIGTRATVAMSGTFGYELDVRKLSGKEQDAVRAQIARFKECDALIQGGDYYRLAAPQEGRFCAWEIAAPDGSEALVSYVFTGSSAYGGRTHLRLKGLNPQATYRLTMAEFSGGETLASEHMSDAQTRAHAFSGASLMYAGVTLPRMHGNAPSAQLRFTRI